MTIARKKAVRRIARRVPRALALPAAPNNPLVCDIHVRKAKTGGLVVEPIVAKAVVGQLVRWQVTGLAGVSVGPFLGGHLHMFESNATLGHPAYGLAVKKTGAHPIFYTIFSHQPSQGGARLRSVVSYTLIITDDFPPPPAGDRTVRN